MTVSIRTCMYIAMLMLLLLCTVSTAAQEQPLDAGTIRGVVLDEEGAPISGAEVNVKEVSVSGSVHTGIRLTETDGSGEFTITPVKFGIYKLYALKPESGYPDTKFEIYAGSHHKVSVAVSAAEPNAFVKVVVGPRAGILKLTVLDRDTRQIIQDPTLILKRIDNGAWVTANRSQESTILVPPAAPTQLTIVAEGYKSWTNYDVKDMSHASLLNLSSGQEIAMTVELEPVR